MARAVDDLDRTSRMDIAQEPCDHEIGIRLTLGAQPAQVQGMILRESTWLGGAGILVGVGAALLLTRLVKSMLYGIQPYDPKTMSRDSGSAGRCAGGGKLDSGTARGRGAAYGGAAPRIKIEKCAGRERDAYVLADQPLGHR